MVKHWLVYSNPLYWNISVRLFYIACHKKKTDRYLFPVCYATMTYARRTGEVCNLSEQDELKVLLLYVKMTKWMLVWIYISSGFTCLVVFRYNRINFLRQYQFYPRHKFYITHGSNDGVSDYMFFRYRERLHIPDYGWQYLYNGKNLNYNFTIWFQPDRKWSAV